VSACAKIAVVDVGQWVVDYKYNYNNEQRIWDYNNNKCSQRKRERERERERVREGQLTRHSMPHKC